MSIRRAIDTLRDSGYAAWYRPPPDSEYMEVRRRAIERLLSGLDLPSDVALDMASSAPEPIYASRVRLVRLDPEGLPIPGTELAYEPDLTLDDGPSEGWRDYVAAAQAFMAGFEAGTAEDLLPGYAQPGLEQYSMPEVPRWFELLSAGTPSRWWPLAVDRPTVWIWNEPRMVVEDFDDGGPGMRAHP